MSYWEYCEVGWTPKRITIHVYSGRSDGGYEGVQEPKEWGSLLAQLGADGWELVGIVPTRPATHTLYYFKRPLDPPEVVELEKQEKLKAEQEWRKRLEEWEKAPPGTILQVHHATIMKPIPGFNLKAALLQLHRATHAEEAYLGLPSDAHRQAARDIFLRLIEPGTTEQDTTRRRADRSEFERADPKQAQQMQETLEAFIRARLLTTNQVGGKTTIEVSHEALIREWKRLAEWLHEARDDIRSS